MEKQQVERIQQKASLFIKTSDFFPLDFNEVVSLWTNLLAVEDGEALYSQQK